MTKITEGLKTVTVGTKKVNGLDKTILLLGETGTGKSTLIDLLVNYAMGVKSGDEVWFRIVEEETRRQSESQSFALLTHSDGGPPENTLTALADAQIKYAKDEQGQPGYFMFNNRQSAPTLKFAWDLTMEQLRLFAEVLNVTEAQTLRTTEDH